MANAKNAPKEARLVVAHNRRAGFEYYFLEKYQAGLVLTGTEVKSVRAGKVNLQDAYCKIENGEAVVRNLLISPYERGGYTNHDPKRTRKLLLTKKEIRRIESKLKESGTTLVPVVMYFNERNFAKIEIALAKGKKAPDKRETIKARDEARSLARGE
ncbi:MAG: SsrA-binding protein SmpB [Bacteroidia bacterium]|nr:SsrA-binding protein SmpB [Bacteroidia bacterium]